MNKHGFSLLFFLLYLLVFSAIGCCVCRIITDFLIPSVHMNYGYKAYISAHCSTDLFVYDIRSAPSQGFKCTELHELVWSDSEKEIGWRYCDAKLERIEGVYADNRWIKKKTAIILSGSLKNLFFEYDYKNNHLIGISITIIPENHLFPPIYSYSALRR